MMMMMMVIKPSFETIFFSEETPDFHWLTPRGRLSAPQGSAVQV